MKNKKKKALTVCKYVSASAFLLLANESNLSASELIEEVRHMAGSPLPIPMFTEADLQADAASLIVKITGYIDQDRFENPPAIITSIIDFIFDALPSKEDDGIPFKTEITNALNTYSTQYQDHSLETSLDTDAYNTSLMNWKKWSSCQYISAKLGNEEALFALQEAIEKKLDLCYPADSRYVIQLNFAIQYFGETRITILGNKIRSNNKLVLIKTSEV